MPPWSCDRGHSGKPWESRKQLKRPLRSPGQPRSANPPLIQPHPYPSLKRFTPSLKRCASPEQRTASQVGPSDVAHCGQLIKYSASTQQLCRLEPQSGQISSGSVAGHNAGSLWLRGATRGSPNAGGGKGAQQDCSRAGAVIGGEEGPVGLSVMVAGSGPSTLGSGCVGGVGGGMEASNGGDGGGEGSTGGDASDARANLNVTAKRSPSTAVASCITP